MQIVLTFEIWALIGVLLFVLLLPALTAWLGYRAGRRNGALWREALRNVPLGVALFRNGDRPSFANASADELLPQLEAAPLEQARRMASAGMRQSSVVRGSDGLVVQVQSVGLREREAAVLLTLRDIGQQQKAEASYRKLIHTLSHEVLTPLTAIQGHLAHLAASSHGNDGAWNSSLQITRDEVERLTRLTSNLLVLSRLEAGQPLQRRPTNLAALAEETVLQLLDKADARHITLHLNAAPRLPRPLLDRDAWKQVLLNLIDNAVKYGTEGGSVTITLCQEQARLLITVADDGPGIAPDDLPHIFSELFRSESQRHVSGSGLGLAIVRRIVERHGGQISCASRHGQGATFSIALPLDAPESAA